MGATEALREALLDLEEARKLEAQQRRMAEALLAGLHVLVASGSATDIFPKLFDVLREPLDFRAAFVLAAGSDGLLVPIAASDVRFKNTLWNPGTAFKRAMKGKPIAVFDTEAVEEWRRQGDELRKQNRSALVFSVGTETRPALFICTHPARGHFSLLHVNLARRFSVLAVQALMKMEADQRVANLEERLKNEARLAELNRKLAESEKKLARAGKLEALGLLAGSVAHDLNNILSGIVSYPDLLLMSPDLPQKQRRIIETIRASGLRAAAVVQDLLTVSRGVAVIQDTVRLNDLIEQFLAGPEYLEIMKDTEGISVQVNLDERPRNIRASRIHVEKALANLFVNALDAVRGGEDGIIGIKTETVHVDRPRNGYEDIALGEYAILTVSDNGPGISEEDRERIFEPFYTKKKDGEERHGAGIDRGMEYHAGPQRLHRSANRWERNTILPIFPGSQGIHCRPGATCGPKRLPGPGGKDTGRG